MDLIKANKARELLNAKDILLNKIRELEDCSAIRGDIVSGPNGRPFRIEQGHKYIKFILEGLSLEIKNIDLEISRL